MRKFKRCECGESAQPGCRHPWWGEAWSPAKGKNVRVSLEKYFGRQVRGRGSAKLADDLVQTYAKNVGNGSTSDDQRRSQELHGLTLNQLIDRYEAEHVETLGTAKEEKRKLRHVRVKWGELPVASLRQEHFNAYARQIEKRSKSGAAVRRPFARLNHMFRWAVLMGFMLAMPYHVKLLQLRREDPPRGRLPTDDELARILKYADPYLKDWIEFKLETGLRSGTMRHLLFSHVAWDLGTHGSLQLPKELFKNRAKLPQRVVTKGLTQKAREILLRRARSAGDARWAVFGTRKGRVYKKDNVRGRLWKAAVQAAGYDPETLDLHEHDLRAESAMRVMRASGGRVDMVRKHLVNVSLRTTEIYIRHAASDSDEIAQMLDEWTRGREDRNDAENRYKTGTVPEFGANLGPKISELPEKAATTHHGLL